MIHSVKTYFISLQGSQTLQCGLGNIILGVAACTSGVHGGDDDLLASGIGIVSSSTGVGGVHQPDL